MAHDEIVEWLRGLIGKLTPQERAALLDESNEDDMRYRTFWRGRVPAAHRVASRSRS